MDDERKTKKQLLNELNDLRRRSAQAGRQLEEMGAMVRTMQAEREKLLQANQLLERKVRSRTQELKRRTDELRELTRKTIEALENERKALSKELHDSIGGTLAAVRHRLEERIEKMGPPPLYVDISLERLNEYLLGIIQETRRISKRLRPHLLEELGLIAALNEFVKEFKELYSHMTVLQECSLAEQNINAEIKTVLFRVAQEALNNAGRHSGASTVAVKLYQQPGAVCLEVHDDGCGFTLPSPSKESDTLRFGIRGMQERVAICHGRIEIHSTPGKGTMIKADIPLT